MVNPDLVIEILGNILNLKADIKKINDFTYVIKIGEVYYSVDIKCKKVREIHSEDIDNIFSIWFLLANIL